MGDGRTERAAKARTQRRRQILDSSLRVFADKGYWRTSISDLVQAAGVARGTFYLYFESKSAVFLDMLDELLGCVEGAVSGVDPTQEISIQEQLVQILARVLETLSDNRPLTRIIFREAVGLDHEVEQRLSRFDEQIRTYLMHTLSLGEQFSAVRQDLDTQVVSACLMGAVREVIQAFVVRSDDRFDAHSIARQVVEFSLVGVAPKSQPGT